MTECIFPKTFLKVFSQSKLQPFKTASVLSNRHLLSPQCTCREVQVPFPSAHRMPGRWQRPSQNISTPTLKADSTIGQHDATHPSIFYRLYSQEKSHNSDPPCSLRTSRLTGIYSNTTCVLSFFLQMSGKDHRRPDDVFPCGHHPDFRSQLQRSSAQLQTGQHLEDRSLPAQSKAAVQVGCPPCLSSSCVFDSHYHAVCVCAATRLRVTPTPETSGSTCRLCSSTCREKLKSTHRPPTTMSASSNIRSLTEITC